VGGVSPGDVGERSFTAKEKTEGERLYHETAEADVMIFELDSLIKEGRGDEDVFARTAEKLRDQADPAQAEILARLVRQFRGALHYELSA